MKKINTKWYEVIFLFLTSLTPLLWLKQNQLILGHDSGFRLNPLNHLYNLFYSWSPLTNFGVDWSFFKGFLITQLPETLFTELTHSLWLGQLLTCIFWFFLMSISMYICINGFFPEKKDWFARVFGGTFYAYNFFILQAWFIAERAKFSLYAALPLGFLILVQTLNKKYSLTKGTILFSLLFFFLNGGGNPPLYGGILITYGIVVGYFLLLHIKYEGIKGVVLIVKVIGVFLLGLGILNSYWIIPQAYLTIHSYSSKLSSTGGIEGLLAWERVISKNASFDNLFRLQGIPDWYENPLHPYANAFLTNWILILGSTIPLLIILLGLWKIYLAKKESAYKQLMTILLSVLLIAVIFSSGTHAPFGTLYELLMKHIPGFAIFRSSYYKFSPALFFAYAFLTGLFLSELFRKFVKRKLLRTIICVISIGALIAYHYPFFVSNFFVFNSPFTTKVVLPGYVSDSINYLNRSLNGTDKVLLLPGLNPSLGADSYTWGYWSLDVLPRIGLTGSVVSTDSDTSLVDGIYAAIDTNNEDLFNNLTKRAGITYILWRGDVLYNDHKTTSANFLEEKENLEHFNHVQLKETFGKWKIFSLRNNPIPLFAPANKITTVRVKEFNFSDLIQITGDDDAQVWVNVNQNIDKDIPEGSKNIQQDSCSFCSEDAIDALSDSLTMPSVRFLPWSKIYPLIIWKEKRETEATNNLPQARIDVDLSHANKRLVEIWRMSYQDFNAQTAQYVEKNVQKYKAIIDDLITTSKKIPSSQKREYLIKIAAYMQAQKKYIYPFSQNLLIKNSIDKTVAFIDEKLNIISQNIWLSLSNEDKKSLITLNNAGVYDVEVKDDRVENYTLFIDGKKTESLQSIPLAAGEHTLELKYANLANYEAFSDMGLVGTTEELNPKHSLASQIVDFSFAKKYTVHFTYKTSPHAKIDFHLRELYSSADSGKDVIIKSLQTDGEEHTFFYQYTPTSGVQNATIQFTARNNAELTLGSFEVQEKTDPRFYFIDDEKKLNANLPQITYRKIDPTTYEVKVSGASNPFVLTFNQLFTPGWTARYKESNSIPEKRHLLVNGYANGWNVEKKGSYTIVIEYSPQQFFYIGIIISALGFGMILGRLIWLIKKK